MNSIDNYSDSEKWALLIGVCVDGLGLISILATLCYYFHLLRTKWGKLRHRQFIYSVLFLDLAIILVFVSLIIGVLVGGKLFEILIYLNGLLVPLQMFLLMIFASIILETFSVLIPWVTATRMRNWRRVITVIFTICYIPSIIQFYYACVMASPSKDTPQAVRLLTASGASLIGIIATLSDTAQTILLASTIFNWTLSRRIASPPIAYSHNQLLYRKSVQLSIITTLSDWTAVGAEAYAAILPTQKNILSYILLIYVILAIIAHSFIAIYQFHILTSIAVSQVKMNKIPKQVPADQHKSKDNSNQEGKAQEAPDASAPLSATVSLHTQMMV